MSDLISPTSRNYIHGSVLTSTLKPRHRDVLNLKVYTLQQTTDLYCQCWSPRHSWGESCRCGQNRRADLAVIESVDFHFFRAGIAAFIGKGTVRNHIGKTVACPTVESQPEQPQHLSKSSPKQKLGRLPTAKHPRSKTTGLKKQKESVLCSNTKQETTF